MVSLDVRGERSDLLCSVGVGLAGGLQQSW